MKNWRWKKNEYGSLEWHPVDSNIVICVWRQRGSKLKIYYWQPRWKWGSMTAKIIDTIGVQKWGHSVTECILWTDDWYNNQWHGG